MPDRLSDTVNVKDWGALGTGGATDDTTKIQAAINYCISRGGGTVFFPSGRYKVSTLTVGSSDPDIGICLVGSGKKATHLYGGSSTPGPMGFMISKQAATYDNIERIDSMFVHGSATRGCGAIRITANTVSGEIRPNCASIINCGAEGAIGVDTSTAVGVFIRDLNIPGLTNYPPNNSPPGPAAGTIGVYLGTGCTLAECRVQGGWDISFALCGQGASLIAGCASEVNRTGVRVGWAPNATTGLGEERAAYGCTVQTFQTERVDIGIDLYNCTGGFISGSTITGTSGPFSAAAAITQLQWTSTAGGTVEVTTRLNHNITAGALVQIQNTPGGWIPSSGAGAPGQIVTVNAVTALNKFTYLGIASPPSPNPQSGGNWTYPQKYGLRCRKVYDTVIEGVDFQEASSIATVDLEYPPVLTTNPPSGAGEADHRNCTIISCNAGSHGFRLPSTNAANLSAWKFIATGKAFINTFPPTTTTLVPNPIGKLTFAALPASPMEGMEFDISDSPTAASGNFGAPVTRGGGSNHVKLRRDASGWKISG
jgi:hypothetical protein